MGIFPATTMVGFIALLFIPNGFSASFAFLPPGSEQQLREFSGCHGNPWKVVVAGSVASISRKPGGFGYENQAATYKGRRSARKLGRAGRRSPPAPAFNKPKSYFTKPPPPLIA